MRVAIVHYWLVGMRGGEKVVEQLCRIYPQADIFTHVVDPAKISQLLLQRIKGTTFINRLPFATRLYKIYLPLMPWALEQLDLRGYDVVISSESGPAKGVLTSAEAVHICYCHSPMRYLWAMYHDYLSSSRGVKQIAFKLLAHYLRIYDVSSAARVDYFVANSNYISKRIQRTYHRNAVVIYPPVDTETFKAEQDDEVEDFYLMVGELVQYKRFDLGIGAADKLGRRLLIVGSGEMQTQLAAAAGSGVTFLGPQTTTELRRLYATCRGLIFPGEEDFGIVPVEAMASGRPVIAFQKGGAVESVKANVTGVFFNEQTVASLCEAISRFEKKNWNSAAIRAHASTFGASRFRVEMQSFVEKAVADAGIVPQPAVSDQKKEAPFDIVTARRPLDNTLMPTR